MSSRSNNNKLESFEKESAIHWDEQTDEAEIYTTSPRVCDRLVKEGLTPRTESWGSGEAWFFKVPVSAVRLKVGRTQCYIAGSKKK